MGESDLYKRILTLIGAGNLVDAMHIDSAYKSGCNALITSDMDDIASKRESIERLTGLKVFHTHRHWEEFLKYIER